MSQIEPPALPPPLPGQLPPPLPGQPHWNTLPQTPAAQPKSNAKVWWFLVWPTVMVLVIMFGIHNVNGSVSKSQETQNHGIVSTAIVVSVDHIVTHRRNNTLDDDNNQSFSDTTSEVTQDVVRLQNGTVTTVYDGDNTPLAPGDQVTVMTDPQDLSYSEFPGEPFAGSSKLLPDVILVLFGAIMVAVPALLFVKVRRNNRRTG